MGNVKRAAFMRKPLKRQSYKCTIPNINHFFFNSKKAQIIHSVES